MSTTVAKVSSSVEEPTPPRPRRRTIATHSTYPGARRTIERLSEAGLPVDDGAILARGVRPIVRRWPSRGRVVVAENFDVVVDVDIADRALSVIHRAMVFGPPRTTAAPEQALGSPGR